MRGALLAVLLLGAAASRAVGQGRCPSAEASRALEVRLQAIMDSTLAARPALNAISVHIEAPGRCLSWSGAAGVADKATGAKLRPEQPVRIASNTKTYVAAAILRLVEDGKVGIDAPISTYLPGEYLDALRSGGYDPAAITMRHLLHHTSGIFDYAMDEAFSAAVFGDPSRRWSRMDQVRWAMERGKPYGAPGTVYHYSDTGYLLLGEILERVTGQGLAPALRQLLGFDRLRLSSTWLETLEPAPAGVADRAHQYMDSLDTYPLDPSFDLYGGGGLVATPKDMATFTRALLTGKVYRDPKTLDLMLSNPGITTQRDYRMGIYAMGLAGDQGYGHSGFWNTFSFHVPGSDVTIASSISQQGLGNASRQLLEAVYRAVR
jgi:D-alanyl-D-alanine carboxypeptidase